LRRYRFTCKSFRDEGKRKCTPEHYNDLCSKIDRVKLSLSFLLAGFDAKNKGHLIVGGGNEAPQDYNALGFTAIGRGRNAALSSLLFHKEHQHLRPSCLEAECVYVVYAAKFMAESATDVGDKSTSCVIVEPNKVKTVLEWWKLREIWKTEGAPRLPSNLEERIAPLILSGPSVKERADEILTQALRRSGAHKSADQQ
jgi:20S proteasome alpha/beta subunit